MKLGGDTGGIRRYNERLVLAALRAAGGASKAEIARRLSLSPQAVIRIVDGLEEEGLVITRGRRFGGRGQPSIIYELNATSLFTIGAHIGRRGMNLVAMNFLGEAVESFDQDYEFAQPEEVTAALADFTRTFLRTLGKRRQSQFLGVGVAMPWFISEWRDKVQISTRHAAAWRLSQFDETLAGQLKCPVFFENDGNAAAFAELFFGKGREHPNYLYIFLGTFVGGGLVLGGALQSGMHGNAAAVASMIVPGSNLTQGAAAPHCFLLERASVFTLEDHLRRHVGKSYAGIENAMLQAPAALASWVEDAAEALAFALLNANAVLDVECIIIDGTLPASILDDLIAAIFLATERMKPVDYFPPTLIKGSCGARASALGAGMLPIHSSFAPNLDALIRSVE